MAAPSSSSPSPLSSSPPSSQSLSSASAVSGGTSGGSSRASSAASSGAGRWLAIVAVLLAIVLVPFVLFEGTLAGLTDRLLAARLPAWLTAPLLALLLASDLFLPVPSSVVSTAAGALFGLVGGTLVSAAGMTAGALVAYRMAASLGRAGVIRLVGAREFARGEALVRAYGAVALAISRPIPVLAEASVFAAAALGIPFGRFFAVVGLSNLGLSAAYALLGATAASRGSFLLVFAGAILLPGAALAAWTLVQRRALGMRSSR